MVVALTKFAWLLVVDQFNMCALLLSVVRKNLLTEDALPLL